MIYIDKSKSNGGENGYIHIIISFHSISLTAVIEVRKYECKISILEIGRYD